MKIAELTKVIKDISKEMTNQQYHFEREHKSSSSFSRLLFNRGDHFFKNPFPEFLQLVCDEGSLFHTMLGEPEMLDEEYSFTSTAKWLFEDGKPVPNPEFMKQRKKQARFKKTLVTYGDLEKMEKKVAMCHSKPKLKRLLADAIPERSFFGEIDGFKVKVRPDLICFDTNENGDVTRVRIIDIKTSGELTNVTNASLSCFKYGYWVPRYMYQTVVENALQDAGINIPVSFDFLFQCRKKSNHKCGLFKSTEKMYELGKRDFERSLEDFKILETGDFEILEEESLDE
jgi:hypothetical protein